jgi:WD40 repeat protein
MTAQQALKTIDRLLEQNHQAKLKDIQIEVLSRVWGGTSYKAIGQELGYDPDYIKQVAAELWHILSEAVGEKVSKSNLRSILKTYQASLIRVDWGEAIDVSRFYGRTDYLETLQSWILNEDCRAIGLYGWGGIGKTALSVKLAQQLEPQFECLVWRSLRLTPTPTDLLNEVLPILTGSEVQAASIDLLMQQLHQKRCLLVLDNIESILQSGTRSGLYLPGYEDYGQIFERMSNEEHQSCLLITSREKPQGMALREGAVRTASSLENRPVRALQLSGLPLQAAQNILIDKGMEASAAEQQQLIDYVNGNPLALKLIATSIQNLFGGDVREFLTQGTVVFGGLWELLDRQFERLSLLQKQVMYWLAINREGVAPVRLKSELSPPVSLPLLMEVLETLRDRSLIESTERGITQQPVIMEYATEQFIQQMVQEIVTGELKLFKTHVLIEAQTKDYLRDAQIQLILQPLIDRLSEHFLTQELLERHLVGILDLLHQQQDEMGYGAGNLLNLLTHLETDLQGLDFSNLFIRQAYLLNGILHDVDFTGSHISQTVFAETFGGVVGSTFSPDGKYLATSDTKGDIQIWEAGTLAKYSQCQGHHHWTWAVSFSPNSQYLASASDDYTVKLWDVASGECLYTYTGHSYSVNTVAFSPDGQTIASSSQDHTIRIWRTLPGELEPCQQVLTGHSSRVWSIAFSPDGQQLISGGEDRTLRVWNIATGNCLTVGDAHEDWIRGVAFDPTGRFIATCSHDRTIKIWDLATLSAIKTLRGHQKIVTAIAFSPTGEQVVSSSFDRTLKLWDIKTGKCLKTFLGHQSRVWTVAFHPNGKRIASGGDDNTTKIWDLKLGRCIHSIVGHTDAVLSLSMSADNRYLASGYEDKTIRIWDVQTGTIVETLRDHQNRVWSVAFDLNSSLLASGSADYTVKLWNWKADSCVQTCRGHISWVWCVDFSPVESSNPTLASSSYDQTIRIWNINTGECLRILTGHTSSVVSVVYSPDGLTLASSEFDGAIKLWDVATGDCLRDFREHTNSAWSVVFDSTGQQLVSASYDQTLKLWDIATGECLRTFTGHEGPVLRAQFSPDDRFIISCGIDCTIRVWDVQTGECLKILTGHSALIYTLDVAEVQWSPTEIPRLTAFTGSLDETIKVWDIERGNCRSTWKPRRAYEGMKIDQIQGLTKAQRATLRALGAI